jgi:ubiquinone/menaquinone biosynthesis C-methylase UbiE
MCCNCTASFFARTIVPQIVHRGCSMEAFSTMRRIVVPEARGIVVEIGFGSGHNLPYYQTAAISRLIGIDPDRHMLALAQPLRRDFEAPLELVEASAERIPLADASTDTVLVTYALCTIPNLSRAIAEMRRVLKPGGRLLFAEHAVSATGFRRTCQDWLDRSWGVLAGGCHLNRDPETALVQAGFAIEKAVRETFSGTLWHLGDHVAGSAVLGG